MIAVIPPEPKGLLYVKVDDAWHTFRFTSLGIARYAAAIFNQRDIPAFARKRS